LGSSLAWTKTRREPYALGPVAHAIISPLIWSRGIALGLKEKEARTPPNMREKETLAKQ